MSVVLVGPYPPPHGGISVHLQGIFQRLTSAGVLCFVLDPAQCRGKVDFTKQLRRFASAGCTIHVHANGHNARSWLLALLCGVVRRHAGSLRILTLHSGMAPRYLKSSRWRRELTKRVCRHYHRIICVNPSIQQALTDLGVPAERTEVAPAYMHPQISPVAIDPVLAAWMGERHPLLSTTLFFRPEYGVDLLISAIARLRQTHPRIGCLIMGTGDDRSRAQQRIRGAGLSEHVQLLGDIEHGQCLQLISRSNAFVRPTLADGDSISVREALSLGIPVVASRVGTRPDGVFLFESGNLSGLLEQLELALSSKRPPAQFSGGTMDRLIEIYRQSRHAGRACA